MAKKLRQGRSFARTASKSQEKYLIDNAKKLYENPLLIIPHCVNDSCKNSFRKTQKKLEKAHRFQDNAEKLEKLAKKKGMDGALAGTLLLTQSEKAPFLAVAKFPSGDVVFAQRGGAVREKLIALQHVDDPVLRLFGIRDVVLKKKLHVYSWDTGYVCTGREAQPPAEFITFLLNKLGFSRNEGLFSCKHLSCDQVAKKACLSKYYLRIHWKSADQIFALCEECTKTSKNTVFLLSKYFLEPEFSQDFDIEVIAQVVTGEDLSTLKKTLYLDEYLSGTLSDYELIQKNVKRQQDTLQQTSKRLFVLDGVSYGSDIQRFIDALQPNQYERIGLDYILKKIDEPVIVSEASSHKILDKYWAKYGKDVVYSLLSDSKMAESFANLDDTPSNILKTATEYRERHEILMQFPRYTSLPPLAKYVDHIVKTYKTYGEKKTLTELRKHPDSTKGKSITYAFFSTFGKAKETKWQFSPVEVEYGEFLKEYAKNLLDASPEQYHTAFQELLSVSGSGETLESS